MTSFVDQRFLVNVAWKNFKDRNNEVFVLARSNTPIWVFDMITACQTYKKKTWCCNGTHESELIDYFERLRKTDACICGGVGWPASKRTKHLPKCLGNEKKYNVSITIFS